MPQRNLNPHGLSVSTYDPIAMGKMRADTFNSTTGDLPGYNCTQCLNRGIIARVREDGTLVFRDCSCKPIRCSVQKMERSGLKNNIRELTFDNYITNTPWQKNLKQAAQRYAKEGAGWFIIGGQPGAGKTHLCTAICRQRLLDGEAVHYLSWRETVTSLKGMSLDSEHRQETIQSYKTAPVLYIDDLFKTGRAGETAGHPTSADIGIAFEIINYRYCNHLPTVISTEMTTEELLAVDEATGSRIIEMAGEHLYSINTDPQKNYRLRSINKGESMLHA